MSKCSLRESASRQFFYIEPLVKCYDVLVESQLKLSVSHVYCTRKAFWFEFEQNCSIVLSMGLPLMLPEEEIAGGSFGLWWPIILHIIEQFNFLLKDGAVKGTK